MTQQEFERYADVAKTVARRFAAKGGDDSPISASASGAEGDDGFSRQLPVDCHVVSVQ